MEEKERILIVDDDLAFLQVARSILCVKGYEVDTAASGGEGIACIQEHFCNVAILDISLPDTDGTELLSTIIGMNPDILAIMLTGHSSVQNAVKSLNLGAFAYLEKPLNPDHLLSVIARGLEKQRLVFENKRLVEELEQRNREAGILLAVSQTVAQSLDLSQILDSALKRISESMGVDASYVSLEENSHLALEGHYGIDATLAEKLKNVEVDGGLISAILKGSSPLIIENITDNGEPFLNSLASAGYKSYVGIPLKALGESIGVMGVATQFERAFTFKEVEMLAAIGREVSIAVRNTQLYEEASSAKALRKLDALRTELLANVSHELRTPLAAIKGFANSLLQPDVKFDESIWHSFVQTIDSEADRLGSLIEGLLTMSRLEAKALELEKKSHSLADIVESLRGRLTNVTLRHNLQINIPEELPEMQIDEARIAQVLSNLVENAAKYSPEGTTITFEVFPEGEEVIVTVSDEGIGIPQEFQRRVFDRFYQVESPAARRKSGAGLGLCICRGIIEAHGGRIWLESEVGKSTTFGFSLPIKQGG